MTAFCLRAIVVGVPPMQSLPRQAASTADAVPASKKPLRTIYMP